MTTVTMIDWDRPYAKICGPPPVHGARLEQDGKYFTLSGELANPTPDRQYIIGLKEQGMSDTEIGEKLGITRQKVTRILCG